MAAASLLPITLDSDILGEMEAWARQQPVDAPVELRKVEKIFETLDIAGLYAILLRECSARTRKSPSYCGGIRISPEDIGAPVPYAALEHYRPADGSEQLWAEIFDLLPGVAMAPGLPQRRQERRLDADPCQGGRLPSQELLRCLRAARLLIEDLEEIHALTTPVASVLMRAKGGVRVRPKECPRRGAAIYGRWRYPTWTGAWAAACRERSSIGPLDDGLEGAHPQKSF